MSKVFQFSSSASLEELTGVKAYSLEELLSLIRTCPESSIFYHTFSAFLKLREVQLPFNSDFALWVSNSLNEKALAERLLAVDLSGYDTIEALRSRLIEIIEGHRRDHPWAFEKKAEAPFFLYDIRRFVYVTDKFSYDLNSFREVLHDISIYSMYFHFIESRLQTRLKTDDFSSWIEESLEMPELAEKIRGIDISVYTLEQLRTRIIELIDQYLEE